MNNLFLSGAGFTKNFGGYLASEIWYKIYNAIDSHDQLELKNKIKEHRSGYDFEGFYDMIINGSYDEVVKESTRQLIYKAYSSLDNVIREWESNSSSKFPISESLLSNFINQFSCFFTTNQDLFIERKLLKAQFFSPLINDNTTYRDMLRRCSDLNGIKVDFFDRRT